MTNNTPPVAFSPLILHPSSFLMLPHWFYILFLFVSGSCIGSFLNVVVWRLPRGKSLVHPPSSCPKCNHLLAWKDNIPVFGWIFLRGKCRYCGAPVSARYPIVEAITGLLFVFYYVAFFILHWGPSIATIGEFGEIQRLTLSTIENDWAIYGLIIFMICGLLAASLIDAELYIIPIQIPWVMALIAFIVHPFIARPSQPGSLSVSPAGAALCVGSIIGLLISNLLLWRKILPLSFPNGDPMLDWERADMEQKIRDEAGSRGASREETDKELAQIPPVASKREIRREILKEAIFVVPPILLGLLVMLLVVRIPSLSQWWSSLIGHNWWLQGLLGSFWGAIVGAMTIWLTRILATFALGRVAMGQGDTHLMIAIGAILGAGPTIAVFFIAPFAGLVIGLYKLATKGARELPYGPYLSLAAAAMVLLYRPIAEYFSPSLEFIWEILLSKLSGA